jgi:hypothetical protein
MRASGRGDVGSGERDAGRKNPWVSPGCGGTSPMSSAGTKFILISAAMFRGSRPICLGGCDNFGAGIETRASSGAFPSLLTH